MRQRYQYLLYGLHGEWLGITARRSATLRRAVIGRDAADPDWQTARERGLTCE